MKPVGADPAGRDPGGDRQGDRGQQARARERGPGGVVRVVRVGQEDRVAALGKRERELDDPALAPQVVKAMAANGNGSLSAARCCRSQNCC